MTILNFIDLQIINRSELSNLQAYQCFPKKEYYKYV